MRLLAFFPLKGFYKPGEPAQLLIEVEAELDGQAVIRLTIWHLAEVIATLVKRVSVVPGVQRFVVKWTPPHQSPRGYGVMIELRDPADRSLGRASTAFDVLDGWTSFPRYGFLTDFTPQRDDLSEVFEDLLRYHLNGLQFYDWQYRHDSLLPPTEAYVDPLGRQLSLDTVRKFIDLAHEHGLAGMPYITVYAASLEFWRQHPDWALYDAQGQPLTFMEFLGLMDPTVGGSWIDYLRDECARLLAGLPFDGLHIDQYGDPKEAFNQQGQPVNLPRAFSDFIQVLKAALPDAALTFNAVGNWPIESLATSSLDFIYIEIWPPQTDYADLPAVVSSARHLSGGKPVVIALYLPADRPFNIRLADALLFSSGGTRIELGERARLLVDPYFPKHQPLSPELTTVLQKYHHFLVRYGELLGPFAGENPTLQVIIPSGIWFKVRTSPSFTTLCLVNLAGLEGFGWHQAHPAPSRFLNLSVEIETLLSVHRVWWGSPDGDDLQLKPAVWHAERHLIRVILPVLEYWSILVFELDDQERGEK